MSERDDTMIKIWRGLDCEKYLSDEEMQVLTDIRRRPAFRETCEMLSRPAPSPPLPTDEGKE
mgnify:CR=1 FL=1